MISISYTLKKTLQLILRQKAVGRAKGTDAYTGHVIEWGDSGPIVRIESNNIIIEKTADFVQSRLIRHQNLHCAIQLVQDAILSVACCKRTDVTNPRCLTAWGFP